MNLGVIALHPEEVSSLYRALGPLTALARYPNPSIHQSINPIRLVRHDGWGWTQIAECHALFFHRPCTIPELQIMRLAKALRVPVWADYDDNLLDDPPLSNPCRDFFLRAETGDVLQWIIANADVLTASTKFLAERIGDRCRAIPNAWDQRLVSFEKQNGSKTVHNQNGSKTVPTQSGSILEPSQPDRVISWRGGPANSHLEDLELALPAIAAAVREFPDWRWIFFGLPHWRIEKIIPRENLAVMPHTDFFTYMKNLCRAKPAIHLVPLVDNEFNRCKSNCAWLEASAAGAAVIAPDFQEWRRPGIINYHSNNALSSHQAFENALLDTLRHEQKRRDALEQSRWFIERLLALHQVNRLRSRILAQLQAPSAPLHPPRSSSSLRLPVLFPLTDSPADSLTAFP